MPFFVWLQTLILGNRDDIEEMSNSSSVVLTTVLKLIDRYDLYGQVAYPKHHKQSDVPDIYRLAAKTKVRSLQINQLLILGLFLTWARPVLFLGYFEERAFSVGLNVSLLEFCYRTHGPWPTIFFSLFVLLCKFKVG